jgi:RimJ/RimL family protein N-acetyltransferase
MFGGVVRGKTTTLRLPVEKDLDAHKRWSADMRVRRAGPIGRWHEPAASETWKERWTEQSKDKISVLWSIYAGDELVGYIHLSFEGAPHSDKVLIDQFVIDPDHAGKGYGWDAALALHRWIFDFMHLRMAVVDRIAADDIGRQRILEKLGHERFGHGHHVYYRDGAFVDQYLYQMELETWDARWSSEREYQPLGDEKTR